jgi:hypothetical protein
MLNTNSTTILDELLKMWIEVVDYVGNFPGRPTPVINWALPEQIQC